MGWQWIAPTVAETERGLNLDLLSNEVGYILHEARQTLRRGWCRSVSAERHDLGDLRLAPAGVDM
eukprot:7999095-Alexandrium_andersonii.AAC.1